MRMVGPRSGLLLPLLLCSAAPATAETLYRFSGKALFDGEFGPVARAQARLAQELAACGSTTRVTADGRFGKGTRDALAELARCPRFAPQLAADAEARAGELTAGYWQALVGSAPPALDERARTIMLTFEATDYTRAEWNFCQSKPRYDPAAGRNVCYSNDPRSYITWGPNGATAGGGREVQLVLGALDRSRPELVAQAFGAEAAAVRRSFVMPDRTPARALETYLCGIWADPARREAWRQGFARIGQAAETRETFDRLYASSSLDGGKIATFFRAYAANGLAPTEIDYAFFKDRAAHTTPKAAALDAAIREAKQAGLVRPWQVRRTIARLVRPAAQQRDRLGRDVAFFVDGAGAAALTAEERGAWQDRGPLRATDAGLSDARPAHAFTPGAPFSTGIDHSGQLTPAEVRACPAAVLATVRP